jgi:hypothetical protein
MQTLKPGRLGLVLHPSTDPTPVVDNLTSWARSHGKQVMVDARDAARVPAASRSSVYPEARGIAPECCAEAWVRLTEAARRQRVA